MNLNLFTNSDAEIITLRKYVDTFLNPSNENYNIFQLPPIQRNSVWNVAQIERLWDSVLRGFPIGSFLLANREKSSISRSLIDGNQLPSIDRGYFLLDGQQRTRALLLGFNPSLNARLWIDLDPNLNFGNPELNDRKFMLRLLTSYQPWGMHDRNPAEKLSEAQKFEARKTLMQNNIHYDYQVKVDLGQSGSKYSRFSWPIGAKLPVPMDLLIKMFIDLNDKFNIPKWEDVCKLIPNIYEKPQTAPSHFFQIVEALKPILDTQNIELRSRSVVLLYQNELHIPNRNEEQDSMEVLFRRVNSGGTVLQGEEMAYSLLKSSWDGAYDMVSSIVADNNIGYLLSPTKIVMAATRLSRYIQNNSDIASPSISTFRKWIVDTSVKESFLKTIQHLLDKGNNDVRSNFHNILHMFCELILYREILVGDIGFPRKFLLTINPNLYHPVLIWIYKNQENKELLEKNRLRVLRFLIYCNLNAEKYDKVSKVAIDIIRESKNVFFPDKEIYDLLVKNELCSEIPSIYNFSTPFRVDVAGVIKSHDELFNMDGDKYNFFRYTFWNKSKILLLWFQRGYASKWFVGYNPTSDDAYDTPYDWDHILPYSHIIGNGNYNFPSNLKEDIDKFWNSRYIYINSIGNLRIWPFWANRSDGNVCHTVKLRMNSTDLKNDNVANELSLKTFQDFMDASCIVKDDYSLWKNASGVPRDWNIKRTKSWQKAVEERVCYFYIQFYEKFEFQDWSN